MRRFILKLAWQAGRIADVDRFAAEIGSRQLIEWQAEDAIAPLGDERLDHLAALIASVASSGGGTIRDFILYNKPPKPTPTREQVSLKHRAGFNAIRAAMSARKG